MCVCTYVLLLSCELMFRIPGGVIITFFFAAAAAQPLSAADAKKHTHICFYTRDLAENNKTHQSVVVQSKKKMDQQYDVHMNLKSKLYRYVWEKSKLKMKYPSNNEFSFNVFFFTCECFLFFYIWDRISFQQCVVECVLLSCTTCMDAKRAFAFVSNGWANL